MARRVAERQGDVLRVPRIAGIEPKKGHDLVVLFLGACELGVDPDVPSYLRRIGFQRIHAFEATVHWCDVETGESQASRHVFLADSPREALAAGVRLARRMTDPLPEALLGLSICLMRLGPVNEDGTPHNGRGQAFVRWSVDSGVALESLLEPPASTCEPAPPTTGTATPP